MSAATAGSVRPADAGVPPGAINDLLVSLDSEWRGANNFCSNGYKTFTLLLRGACTPSHGTGAWISLRNIQ